MDDKETASIWLLLGSSLIAVGVGLLLAWLMPGRRPNIANVETLGKDPGRFGLSLSRTIKHYDAVGWRDALAMSSTGKIHPYYLYALDRTILSAKYLPELAWLPESTLSHRASINKRHLGEYNGMDVAMRGHLHADIPRVQLTNSIGSLLPLLNEELHLAALANLQTAAQSGETLVNLYDFVYTLIVRMTSRTFVGLPLARDEEWLSMVEEHPKLMFAVTASLKRWPSYLRPLVAPHVKAKQQLDAYRQRLHDKLDLLIDDRRNQSQLPKAKRALDMLQWLVDASKGEEASNDNIISKLMFLNLASLNTTASTLTQVILELCQRREYICPLQNEARTVLSEENGWNVSVLRKLRKLDSFVKETQRLNPLGYFGFVRVAMQPVELADGLKIPKGESIGIATSMVAQDEAHFTDPQQFDGFRFAKLRSQPGKENQSEYLFSGTGQSMMPWGFGRLTCPGRWYAEAQIKLIAVFLLTECHFAFPGDQVKRPENFVVGDLLHARRDQKISLVRQVSA